jgi:phosphate:Na+ symporter
MPSGDAGRAPNIATIMAGGIWMAFGGIGLFLAGIWLMEAALGRLVGRNFKLLLRRNTANDLRAALTGAVTTAVLQSSSIVSLLTLSFAGSGLIRLRNALAVILGANVGTTLSNGIIATLGFGYDIDAVWYPLLGIAGIGVFLFEDRRTWGDLSRFLLGIAFLFIALGFLKQGMGATVRAFDLRRLEGAPTLAYVLAGFAITFLIQSSTATMAIALSALHAQALAFETAVALVIGSELGTSLKLLLVSAGHAADKRRVAVANIVLNGTTTLIAYAGMHPLIGVVRASMGVSDPLQALVAFQFLINMASALLFLPFLGLLSRRLERRFHDPDHRSSLYLDERVPALPGLALEVFRLEVFFFLKRVLAHNAAAFRIDGAALDLSGLLTGKEESKLDARRRQHDPYADLKKAQGELMEYYVRMQKRLGNPADLALANRWMQAVQEAMHAAKGFKDIHADREELLQSGNDVKFSQFALFSRSVRERLSQMAHLLQGGGAQGLRPQLEEGQRENRTRYLQMLDGIYRVAEQDHLPEKDISTLQNMNRELFSAHRAMLQAIGDFLTEEPAAGA